MGRHITVTANPHRERSTLDIHHLELHAVDSIFYHCGLVIAEQDIVYSGNIDAGDVSVAIYITVHNVAGITVKQPVVDSSDINTIHVAVTIHIALDCRKDRQTANSQSK